MVRRSPNRTELTYLLTTYSLTQVARLSGGAAESEALLQVEREHAREARVELLRRQMVRRMTNAGLANAWIAWVEFWAERTYAMGLLRTAASRLHAPELSSAFSFWADEADESRRLAAMSASARRECVGPITACLPHDPLLRYR